MILKGKTEVSGGPSTIMVGYMLGIASELESRGVNAVDLLERAGVSNPLSNDPFNRCPSSLLCDVLRLSVEATQDRHFGLHAARSMKAPDLHVLGLGLMASGSMLAFCQRLARFLPLIHRTGSVQVLEEPVGYRIVTVSEMAASVEDSWQALLHKLLRQVYSAELRPLRVEMSHGRPRGGADEYEAHFDAPVSFGHEASAMVFEKEAFEQPLRSGCEELARELDGRALSYMARIGTGDILARVQSAILECLNDQRAATLDAVTERARLSARQVRQHLNDQGMTFQRVLDDTRLFLAHSKLRNRKLPITEVAYLLGFNDSANFTRAFKRWSGQAPQAYRQAVLDRQAGDAAAPQLLSAAARRQ
mgnify:CR=1 FL=1